MAENPVLTRHAASLMIEAHADAAPAHVHGEARYAARSWTTERRIMIKAEVVRLAGRAPRDNPRFVITNLLEAFIDTRARGGVDRRDVIPYGKRESAASDACRVPSDRHVGWCAMLPNDSAFERHYRTGELAEMWGLGRETIRLLVKDEPDMIKIRCGRRKVHTTYSVPASVAARIHTKLVL